MKRKRLMCVLAIVAMSLPLVWLTADVEAKPIKLNFSHMHIATNPQSLACEWWLKEVEKRAGGKVQIVRYWAGSLLPGKENLEGLKAGVADLASIAPSWSPAHVPLYHGLISAPLVSSDETAMVSALLDLRDEPALVTQIKQFAPQTADFCTQANCNPMILRV